MRIWNWVANNPDWDNLWLALFARLARDQPGRVDWSPYVDTLFTRMVKAVGVPVGTGPHRYALGLSSGSDRERITERRMWPLESTWLVLWSDIVLMRMRLLFPEM